MRWSFKFDDWLIRRSFSLNKLLLRFRFLHKSQILFCLWNRLFKCWFLNQFRLCNFLPLRLITRHFLNCNCHFLHDFFWLLRFIWLTFNFLHDWHARKLFISDLWSLSSLDFKRFLITNLWFFRFGGFLLLLFLFFEILGFLSNYIYKLFVNCLGFYQLCL